MSCYTCDECGRYTNKFTYNQLRKEYMRCMDCTGYYPFNCESCDRGFSTQNALQQHSVVHTPRKISCPLCGLERFRNPRDAVSHIESGYCPNCPGAQNAAKQIYRFTQRNASQYLSSHLMIEDGYDSPPDLPYICDYCGKKFQKLSSMMQHQAAKHDTNLSFAIEY